jgi:2-dehydro-3-deoxygluconokinase
MMAKVADTFPNLTAVVVTLRTAKSASINGWGAMSYHGGQFHQAPQRDVEIFDRVGGGDSVASGFIYGVLTGQNAQWALDCGVAHGALAMSTPGDTSMATCAEVLRAMKGGGARISR